MRETIKRKIVSRMGNVKRDGVSKLTPTDKREIKNLFNKLESIDEALYLSLVIKYKDTIQKIH